MATSGVTNFTVSRDVLIASALRKNGGLGQGETATSVQLSEGATALNLVCMELQAMGMPLWAMKQTSFTPTAAAASYTIGTGGTVATPAPLKVMQGWVHDTTTSADSPMLVISREQYNRLGNKTSPGQSSQLYYDPQLVIGATYPQGTLYLYPVPDAPMAAAKTVYIFYQRPFEDFNASSDVPDFPQWWYGAIMWKLSESLCPEYGTAPDDRTFISKMAVQSIGTASSFDTEEGSLYLGVDMYGSR